MNFFTRKCAYCGMKITNPIEMHSKKFCSYEHAQKFNEELERGRHSEHGGHHGCC